MLNFKLKDPYTILYKEKQEIKLLRDKDGVLNMITPNNQEELNRDIRDYFLKNPFARLLENLSRRDISIANIITMYHFLSNVNRNYDILNEQFKINKDKDYKAILAVRQKDGISIDSLRTIEEDNLFEGGKIFLQYLFNKPAINLISVEQAKSSSPFA